MHIGSLSLSNDLLLAPLVRVSDPAFRMVCREQGASLAFTEMLYAQAIVHQAPAILAMAAAKPNDRPLGVQLAAFEPKVLAQATAVVAKTADLVDLNLGCPVSRAQNCGVGAVLLHQPTLVGQLVAAMRSATEKPITAKIRLLENWKESVKLAQVIESAGADAVTVHGRTPTQRSSTDVNLKAVAAIKEAVSIPVINNGGVTDATSLNEIRKKTGCAGFMLARSAIGNPGIFAQLQDKKGISKRDGLKRYLEICDEIGFRNFGRIKQQSLRFAGAAKDTELCRKLEKSKSTAEIATLIK